MSDIIGLTAVTGCVTVVAVCAYLACGRIVKTVRFRHCFAERGISWSDACAAVDRGQGRLVLDHVIARSKGISSSVVWWLPRDLSSGESIARQILAIGELTDCPRSERSLCYLRQRFEDARVIENLEAVDVDDFRGI